MGLPAKYYCFKSSLDFDVLGEKLKGAIFSVQIDVDHAIVRKDGIKSLVVIEYVEGIKDQVVSVVDVSPCRSSNDFLSEIDLVLVQMGGQQIAPEDFE